MENLSDDDFAIKDNSTQTSDATTFAEYQAALVLWKVWSPCILLLGGFGNMATIFVMRRIKDHNCSQHAILMALALSDLFLLYLGVSREWIRHQFLVEIKELHSLVCKIHKYVMYCVNTSSAWLVTCVTVQRTMSVLWPHRMRMMWTVRRTWIVVGGLVLTAFALNLHLALGIQITEDRCDAGPGVYEYFYRHIFVWMDMCASSLFPSLCLFICDVILSFSLFEATTTTTTTTTSGNSSSRRKTASKTTVMILTLSCTFFVLTMPVYVFFVIWYGDVDTNISQSPGVLASMKLISTVTHLLWYSNSAINFLLYCLTGTKYRREFWNWVRGAGKSLSSVGETSVENRGGKYKQQDSTQLPTLS